MPVYGGRLDRLAAVARELVSELDLDQVLEHLLQTARELTGARFAALGVLDAERDGLARFISSGIDEERRRIIGDPPRGRGVLGVLIDDPRPLRLHDVGTDPRAFGVPAGHPALTTFLGVPVVIGDTAWGNLYLANKAHGADFDEEDEWTGRIGTPSPALRRFIQAAVVAWCDLASRQVMGRNVPFGSRNRVPRDGQEKTTAVVRTAVVSNDRWTRFTASIP